MRNFVNRELSLPVLLVVLIGLWLGAGCASGVYRHPLLVSGDEPSAELVVLRKDEMWGAAVALLVRLDGEKLVKLRTGRYAEFRIQPDVYRLSMDPGNFSVVPAAVLDPLRLELRTRTYVLLGKHHIAWGGQRQYAILCAGSLPTDWPTYWRVGRPDFRLPTHPGGRGACVDRRLQAGGI